MSIHEQVDYSCFKVEIEAGVAHIQLKRPEAMNTMTRAFWNELPAIVKHIDDNALARCIVITSTGASEFLIGPDLVRESRNGDNRPLLLIDIAVPRDVDPSVRELPGVHLFDIDDLRSVARENLNARRAEIQRVEAIVEEEVARFSEWLRSLQVVPTIAALRKRAEAIQRAELARTLPRLNLSEDARRRVEAMSAAIVKRLLHDPILRLKQENDGERYVAAVRELFRLEPGAADDGDNGEEA
ncbi:MAG: hypothetical protein K6U89_17805 [Chloroflexi bacterium]|nr:hypothetical protein [Chloroflexota bacterium]